MSDTGALQSWAPRMLSVLRMVAAVLFFEHGAMKLLQFPPSPMFANLQLFSLMGVAGVLEFAGGLLLILGLFTRPVAFLLSGEMAVAYFMAHAPKSLYPAINQGEAAILYCFVFLYLVFAGGGPWSLDDRFRRRGGA